MEVTLEALTEGYSRIITTGHYQVFLFLVITDIVTGFVKGIVNKEANSTKGLLGVVKHLLVVFVVLTATPYLVVLELKWVAIPFIWSFIASYEISAVENWVQIGLPMPEFVKHFFEKLHRTTNEINMKDVKFNF